MESSSSSGNRSTITSQVEGFWWRQNDDEQPIQNVTCSWRIFTLWTSNILARWTDNEKLLFSLPVHNTKMSTILRVLMAWKVNEKDSFALDVHAHEQVTFWNDFWWCENISWKSYLFILWTHSILTMDYIKMKIYPFDKGYWRREKRHENVTCSQHEQPSRDERAMSADARRAMGQWVMGSVNINHLCVIQGRFIYPSNYWNQDQSSKVTTKASWPSQMVGRLAKWTPRWSRVIISRLCPSPEYRARPRDV